MPQNGYRHFVLSTHCVVSSSFHPFFLNSFILTEFGLFGSSTSNETSSKGPKSVPSGSASQNLISETVCNESMPASINCIPMAGIKGNTPRYSSMYRPSPFNLIGNLNKNLITHNPFVRLLIVDHR